MTFDELASRPASSMTIREAFTLGAMIGLLSEGYSAITDIERDAAKAGDAALRSLLKGETNE